MKKRILYICLVTVLGLNLLLGAQIYVANAQAAETENVYEEIRLMMRVMERVRQGACSPRFPTTTAAARVGGGHP